MGGLAFSMEAIIVCVLIGELRPLPFNVNIENYVLFPLILLFL
jgi:hypothetical protein